MSSPRRTGAPSAAHATSQQLPPLDAARVLQQVRSSRGRFRLLLISSPCFPLAHALLLPLLAADTAHVGLPLQALAELELVKKQIRQPFMGKSTVEDSIARLEGGLRAKTQVRHSAGVSKGILHACMHACTCTLALRTPSSAQLPLHASVRGKTPGVANA